MNENNFELFDIGYKAYFIHYNNSGAENELKIFNQCQLQIVRV